MEHSSFTQNTKPKDFEAMESRILDFLEENGVEFTNPNDHWKKKKFFVKISSDSSEEEEPTAKDSIIKLRLSCPLYLKRKIKN